MSSEKVTPEKATWDRLRRQLNKDNYNYSDAWDKAIKLFRSRIKGKFIDPVSTLLLHDKKKGQGFPIMTICCTLVECFAAFRSGKVYNHNYNKGKDPNYQYKDSLSFFVSFITETMPFSEYFEAKKFDPADFYSNVRSALIHECRTRNNWVIRTAKSGSKKVILAEAEGKKIIYRTSFFEQLTAGYFDSYCQELKDKNNHELRRFFARKMDHLFEYNRNQKEFDWWKND